MRQMQRRSLRQSLNLIVRFALFVLMVSLGVTIALVMGETSGLALTDLSNAPVQTITASGEVMYAVLGGGPPSAGIYRSNDYGRTWQLAGSGPEAAINVLAVHPINKAVLFAGSKGGPMTVTNNLWRSDDAGQSWRKFFLSLPAHPDGLIPDVTALAVDPHQPEILYVGTNGQGVYGFNVGPDGHGYSMVGGISFHTMHIKSLIVGPDSRIYTLTDQDIFVSNDGNTWQKLTPPPETPLALAVAGVEAQTLYVISAIGNIYRSPDGGQSWGQAGGDWWIIPDAALRGTALTVDNQDAGHVALSTAYEVNGRIVGGAIYETRDAGQNWAKVADAHDVITRLIINDKTIYAATSKGVVKYGQAEETGPSNLFASIQALTNLTFTQIVVLCLTVGLAGLMLLGRVEWIQKGNFRHGSVGGRIPGDN